MIITSAKNETVKRLRKLMTSGKARRDENTYVAEGTHLARSFLTAGSLPELIVTSESALENSEIEQLVKEAAVQNVQQIVLSDSVFESIANIHAGVGILVIFTPVQPVELALPLTETTVLLEDIQDPGNLGTILRTTAAVGIRDVLLSPKCASPWSPKALRAGMGAQFGLQMHEGVELEKVVKSAKIPTIVTTLSRESISLYDLDLTSEVAWIFGNEGQGVSKEIANLASKHVLIPQAETPVESLNVAAATAVCLYEQYRQINSVPKAK